MSWLFRLVGHREVINLANALDIVDFFAYRNHITPVLEYGYNSGQCPRVLGFESLAGSASTRFARSVQATTAPCETKCPERGLGRAEGRYMYSVYLIECSDGSLYTGITTDVERRFNEHKNGIGGHYTSSKKVVRVAYTEEHPNRSSALKREAQIKGWTRQKKLNLIHYGHPKV